MDSIVSSALEEICRRGKSGVALASLWNDLVPALASAGLELEPGLKSALWLNLLDVPELQFRYCRGEKDAFCSSTDRSIQHVEDAEELGLKIVGSDGLRGCFLGLYDDHLADSEVSKSQRKALELLALARTAGIAQSELSKVLGIEANNFAYELKSLESRKLITRQPAILRTGKARCPGDSCKVVSTNLVFMSRYSKHLGSRGKFEVSRQEKRLDIPTSVDGNSTGEDGFASEGVEEEVLVKDYLPAMRLVCERLEKADGTVLAVKDIKKELGFVGSSSAHKAWTTIRRMLEDAGFVKEQARVGDKDENCLQLVKNFYPNAFVSGAEDIDNEHQVTYGRKNHHNEIVMELPVQQQIYHMVADSGSKGVTSMEVQKRLGTRLSRWFSKNYTRLGMDREKVGVVRDEGSNSKAVAYRYRILGNLNLTQSVGLPSESRCLPVQADNQASNVDLSDIGGVTLSDSSTAQCNGAAEESVLFNPEELHLEQMKCFPDEDGYPGQTQTEANIIQAALSSPVTSLTTNEIRRRQKILDRLQDEKFILKRELYGWLVNLEKERGMTMCRKTMDKILKKLEQQGLCKRVHTNDNPSCSRSAEVVLHPSVSIESISAELQEKIRSLKPPKRGPVKTLDTMCPDPQPPRPEATQADGSTLGKMVGAKSTLQQAIQVYYQEHEQEHHKYQGDILTDQETRVEETHATATHIRKRFQEAILRECTELDIGGCMRRRSPARQLDRAEQFREGEAVSIASSRLHDSNLQVYDKAGDHPADIEESEPKKSKVCTMSINRNASSAMNPIFRRRFTWTDEADRKLVIQYTRIRAVKGGKFQRVDWNQLPDLPAPQKCCRRRISLLKKNFTFRKNLMGLCNILSKRFLKHLGEKREGLHNNNSKVVMKDLSKEGLNIGSSNNSESTSEVSSHNGEWDNFDDKTIKAALEKVLQYKRRATLEEHHDDCIYNEENDSLPSDMVLSDKCIEDINHHTLGRYKDSVDQSNSCHLHKKHTKLSNNRRKVSRKVHRSVAVSNAVELLKLVLLSPLREDGVLNQSAELLRQFSNDELFAAFSYLSEKKFMILRNGDQPLLSHTFLENISKSQFHPGTGQQAAEFSRRLRERLKDLIQGQVFLDRVGEAEDFRSLKRKSAGDEFPDCGKAKRPKSIATDVLENRREKGFPGIRVLVEPASISGANVLTLLEDGDLLAAETRLPQETNNKAVADQFNNTWFPPGCDYKVVQELDDVVPMTRKSDESSWDAMTWYAGYLMLTPSDGKQATYLTPDIFRAVYSSLKRSGEQGLTAKEVSHIIEMPDEAMPEIVMDVLQAFGLAIKVNGYDSTRLTDALYCSKYSLPSRAVSGGDCRELSWMKSQERSDDCTVPHPKDNNHDVGCLNSERVAHRDTDGTPITTITDCHKDVGASTNTVPSSSARSLLDTFVVPVEDSKEATSISFSYDDTYKPILPWLNIDGTVNEIVFNGLICNILGFVMQNPGTTEDNIIRHVDILNPQSCRKLLDLMILDKNLIVRKMHQATSRGGAPPILRSILGNRFRDSKSIVRDHFFANPTSTAVL
ncbi:uncharacterized protein LOC115737322 isoform X2 [Rhodamnia argentea]|uniref:Uncharacterized protein LOC115737322 isoform X2 n=1 Tax=Rhodamnia argentea TaxID=178133 RepID=A0A8B8NRV9_9MYRT|nr:uncharacterized protein LOC115737322 isoform X2 [Rhodamnia argentea]